MLIDHLSTLPRGLLATSLELLRTVFGMTNCTSIPRYWNINICRFKSSYIQFNLRKIFCLLKYLIGTIVKLLYANVNIFCRGLLDYKEPVCRYWPEFAQKNKDQITLDTLLSHRVCIPNTSSSPDLYAYKIRLLSHRVSYLCLWHCRHVSQPHRIS